MMLAALLTWTKTSLVAVAVVLLGIPAFHAWKRISSHPDPLLPKEEGGEAHHD